VAGSISPSFKNWRNETQSREAPYAWLNPGLARMVVANRLRKSVRAGSSPDRRQLRGQASPTTWQRFGR